ncbi:putative membrane transporter protein [Echria macrotheca]|uniref:Membrane transporter protein n=1 Tax=Echria macrotheca TaxID=438768 RepID=A0AAJ0BH39_9PEZI|nr:putative membrane transporter protein [Echria macrotheca]
MPSWRSDPRFIVLTVAVGQFSDFFLFAMRVPLLPSLVRSHLDAPEHDVQSLVASLLASFSIATLVTAIPAGWLADFPSLRGKLYLAGLGALFWSTVTFYTSSSYAMIVFSRVLNGSSAALLYAAGFSIVADAVAPGDLGKALGTIRSIVAAGDLVGPPLGGLIFSRWGFDGILNTSIAVLSVDLVMRLLMIERRCPSPQELGDALTAEVTETDRLLPAYSEPEPIPFPARQRLRLPILMCLTDSQLAVALALSFMQCVMLGSYDATLAMEAGDRFGLSPEQIGAVFLGLAIPVLTVAPFAGWAVDRYGPRKVAVAGFGCFVPTLSLVALLSSDYLIPQLSKFPAFFVLLSAQGFCLALVSTPSIVKAKQAVEKAVQANPRRFGPQGATGQMFGLNTVVSSLGLMVGNWTSALLRESVGYTGMNLILGGACLFAAVAAAAFFDEDTKASML